MEQVVKMTKDVTLYENHTDMYYDLIFTPAGDVITTDNRKCECGNCHDCIDWQSGDIVNW